MTATSGPGRTGRPRSTAADDAILRATLDVVVEHGIRDASVDEIAARAHAGKDTIYRRWSHKDELIRAALEHALDADIVVPSHGDLADDLARYLEALDRMLAAPTTGTILREMVAEAPRDRAVALRLAAFRERHVSTIARILEPLAWRTPTAAQEVAALVLGWAVGRRLLDDAGDPAITAPLPDAITELLAALDGGPRPTSGRRDPPVSGRRGRPSD